MNFQTDNHSYIAQIFRYHICLQLLALKVILSFFTGNKAVFGFGFARKTFDIYILATELSTFVSLSLRNSTGW